jgi:uncharacterized protein YbbK (DUF523 family)
MVTVRVYEVCNASSHSDEQHFIYSLYPSAAGTYVGDEMHKHTREKFGAGKNKKLVAMMMAESPSCSKNSVEDYGSFDQIGLVSSVIQTGPDS